MSFSIVKVWTLNQFCELQKGREEFFLPAARVLKRGKQEKRRLRFLFTFNDLICGDDRVLPVSAAREQHNGPSTPGL